MCFVKYFRYTDNSQFVSFYQCIESHRHDIYEPKAHHLWGIYLIAIGEGWM